MVKLSFRKTCIRWYRYSLFLLLALFSLVQLCAQDTNMIYSDDPSSWDLINSYPDVNIIHGNSSDPTIPYEYSFYPRYVPSIISYVRSDGANPGTGASNYWNNMTKGSWILVKNVGKYKGQWIDMKVTYTEHSSASNTTNPTVRMYMPTTNSNTAKGHFLEIRAGDGREQRSVLLYEFFLSGTFDTSTGLGTRVNVAGFWNLFRVNDYKAVNVPNPSNSNIYVFNQTGTSSSTRWQMYYKLASNEFYSDDMYIAGTVTGENSNTNLTYTFDEVDHFYRIIQLQRNNSTTGYTKYDVRGMTKIEMPPASYTASETTFDNAEYIIGQLVPPLADVATPSLYYYTGYELEADIPDILDSNSLNL